MTAPVAEKASAPRRIPFLYKFPPDHWLAGMDVERGRLCRCNKRFFSQGLVNHDYLDSLRPPQSKAFVERVCEVEKMDKPPGARIWTPRSCHECSRKEALLTQDEQMELAKND